MKQAPVNIKNKRATFDYEIVDTFTAGIVLTGTEIKSIRLGKASLVDTFCFFARQELWVKNMHIAEYFYGSYNNHVASELQKAGLDIPLMIGGATTSKLHTALKIAPVYSGIVAHMKDAAQNATVASRLLNPEAKEKFAAELNKEYESLRLKNADKKVDTVSIEEAQTNKLNLF